MHDCPRDITFNLWGHGVFRVTCVIPCVPKTITCKYYYKKSPSAKKKDRFVNIWCREVDSYLTFWYKRNHVSRISTTTQPELNKIGFTLRRVTVQSLYPINLFNGAPLGLCNLSKLWNPIFPFSSRFSHKMHSFFTFLCWYCMTLRKSRDGKRGVIRHFQSNTSSPQTTKLFCRSHCTKRARTSRIILWIFLTQSLLFLQ